MPLALEQFGENAGKPPVRLLLKNEIGTEDTQIPEGDAGFYKLGPDELELHANIELIIPKTSNGDYNARKRSLHLFLNENMTGPFFVHQEEVQTLKELGVGYFPITVLDPSDLDKLCTFAGFDSKVVMGYSANDATIDKNGEILAKWKDKKIKRYNPYLYKYAKRCIA